MSKDIKDLNIKPMIASSLHWLRVHLISITFVIIALLYSVLILQINRLNRIQPTDEAVQQQVQKVAIPTINEQTAEKLKNLEDNNQNIKSIFEDARRNPFEE